MIYDLSPVTFSVAQQLNPEQLNRVILQAVRQLEEVAARRYRYFDFAPPISTTTEICRLPVIDGFEYLVERATVTGTYTGNKTLRWRYANDDISNFRYELALPADGNDGVAYSAVMLPGVLLSGTTNSNNFVLYGNDVLPAMRSVVSCRSVQGAFADSPRVPAIELFQDGDVLTAARWQGIIDVLTAFKDRIVANSPLLLSGVYFQNFNSGTASYLVSDRIIGNERARILRVVGTFELSTGGNPGDTVTVGYGFGSTANTTVVDVGTGSVRINFDSGALSIQDTNRSFQGNNDRIHVQLTPNFATPNVIKSEIYILQDNDFV